MDIHTLCSLGDTEFLKLILESDKVDVNERNCSGWTPLMYACWGAHEAVVSLLVNADAKKDQLNNDGQTPLILAAKSGSLHITQLLFQSSILDHFDNYGKTALFYAVEFNYEQIASYLLAKGANSNICCRGMTPLMVASVAGHLSLVELLLSNGAKRETRNKEGQTALQLALKYGHVDIMERLEAPHSDFTHLKDLLELLSLEKYWPLFNNNNIDLQKFLKMNEDDLKSIGIKLLGPRRKMYLAINSFTKLHPNFLQF